MWLYIALIFLLKLAVNCQKEVHVAFWFGLFCLWWKKRVGHTPRGSCNRTLLRRVLRRFSNSKCFLEGFLEGACKEFQ